MAQAFSSFDTYLAPFVKVDNLSYKEVKQCIQSFIFGVNTPSRWGCVDDQTEVLSVAGFKKYNELHEGDLIYTWNDGKLELNPVRKIVIKEHNGKMHLYKGRGYLQMVSPDHRVLYKKHHVDAYDIAHSEDIFKAETPYALPVGFKGSGIPEANLTDMDIQLAAAIYTDGSIDVRNGNVHNITIFKSPERFGNDMIENAADELGLDYSSDTTDGKYGPVNRYVFYGESAKYLYDLVESKTRIADKFMTMSMEQADLFLTTWACFDGDETKLRLQYDNAEIAAQLQQIAILAGHCSYLYNNGKANYVKIRVAKNIYPAEREEEDYNGIIWCPNVENGTAVFRKDGCVFISGQCQAPFSNITLDWTVPADLANLPAIVGGKEMDFTYGDCKKEMDMVNKAFIEIMIEGDANGRGFQYPIPSYSITKDFDWSPTENNKLLFEMTAKYGTPYFSNYINSDMDPSDVRSMAILGTQNIIYMDKFHRVSKNEIRHLVKVWKKNPDTEYWVLMNGQFVRVIDMFEVPYEKYDKYVSVNLSNGQSQSFSYDHKCVVVRDGQITNVLAQDVLPTDKFLLARKAYDESEIGTYKSGKIIGYYLAEGWIAHNGCQIDFAININSYDICSEIYDFFTQEFAARVVIEKHEEKNYYRVKVFSKAAAGFVKGFVSGSKATKKRLTCAMYDTSADFRRGVYDGYLRTDGSEKARIFAHTTNRKLCEDMISLFATIGKYFKYQVNNNNTRYFKADKSDYEHFSSYKLILYHPEVYNDDYYAVGVESVNLLDAKRIDRVYNFTVDTPEHIYELPNGIITHQCCRLRLDLRELRKKSGGYFGSGESTGSIGVVTLNIPRLAYLAADEADFYARLDKLMDIAARSLDIKRKVITKLLDNGLYPYTKFYLGDFHNHFSTIGLVGMNEAGLNAKWLRCSMADPRCQQFAKEVLDHMRERLSDYQEKYGDLFNLEATPAESTSYRLAKHDVETYPDIITAAENGGTPYYTNSSHLPVGYTEDIFSALDVQDDLQTRYTSGTVFHAFLGEKLPSWQSAAALVRKIAENYRLPYYTLSPTYSVCPEHGYLAGEHFTCPKCGKESEVYSRITGYYRPVQNWNAGKTQEYHDRKVYTGLEHKRADTAQSKNDTSDQTESSPEKKAAECTPISAPEGTLLFATATCPNCRIACTYLDKAGYAYTKLLADEHAELAMSLGVKQAPTLLVPDGNGGYDKYAGAGAIKGFLDEIKKA